MLEFKIHIAKSVRIYQIADKLIDLNRLVSIESISRQEINDNNDIACIQLIFEYNNVAVFFTQKPSENRSEFLEYVGNERLKLIAAWTNNK